MYFCKYFNLKIKFEGNAKDPEKHQKNSMSSMIQITKQII